MKQFAREIRNNKYEVTDEGILLPQSKVLIGGVFTNELIRDGESLGEESSSNLVVNEGLDHVLNTVLHGDAQVTTWYIGLFKGNYTPVAGLTAATVTAASTESEDYTQATRVAYNEAASTAQSTTNSANKAQFDINATVTMYGAFLASASGKSATTGTLLAASKFTASRAVISGDQLLVTYTLNITST